VERSRPMATPFERTWEAAQPRATVALVHGLAEHSGRYEHVGARLAGAGYSVYTADLRGHGRSEGFPGAVSGLSDWLKDAASIVDRARGALAGRPVFLLGHSLGALISAAYLARNPDAVDGAVLSGLAVLAGTALLASMADPDGQGIPPSAISRDPEVVRAYVDDPLVFADRVSPEANAAALEAAIEVNQAGPLLTLPILMVHGGDDPIADVEGARDLFASIASEDKELIVYDGLYHEVMNEPERERVLDDIVAWLDRHAS
jgi:alpha-beta hydrolase superfamily lysophospholipase